MQRSIEFIDGMAKRDVLYKRDYSIVVVVTMVSIVVVLSSFLLLSFRRCCILSDSN